MIIILRLFSIIFSIFGVLFFLILKNRETDLKYLLNSKNKNFFLMSFWLNFIVSIFSLFENHIYYYEKYLLFFGIVTIIVAIISLLLVFFYENIKDKMFEFLYKNVFSNIKYIDIFTLFWIVLFAFLAFKIS